MIARSRPRRGPRFSRRVAALDALLLGLRPSLWINTPPSTRRVGSGGLLSFSWNSAQPMLFVPRSSPSLSKAPLQWRRPSLVEALGRQPMCQRRSRHQDPLTNTPRGLYFRQLREWLAVPTGANNKLSTAPRCNMHHVLRRAPARRSHNWTTNGRTQWDTPRLGAAACGAYPLTPDPAPDRDPRRCPRCARCPPRAGSSPELRRRSPVPPR